MAIGAGLGGAANAWANYNAYMTGNMTGFDYAKSIVFGAGTGALSAIPSGILGNAIAGAVGASANNLFNQAAKNSPCIDWSRAGYASIWGVGGGLAAGIGLKIGDRLLNWSKYFDPIIPKVRPYDYGKLPSFPTYKVPGGAVGMAVGTVVSN